MKRIISILITLSMILSLGTTTFAKSDAYDKALFDITSLKIFVPDENGEYRTEDKLTRAEFATVILRVMGYGNMTFENTGRFPDVKADDWFSGAVEAVASFEIMIGDDTGYFRPEDFVSFEEATKTIVKMLGYEKMAIEMGGYPTGYLNQAAKLGVLDGLALGNDFLRGDLAVMIHNALDVTTLKAVYSSTGEVVYSPSGRTMLNILMGQSSAKMYKFRGVVKATAFSYTDYPISGIGENQVAIGDNLYNIGNTAPHQYLGMEVDLFCSADSVGRLTLVSITPTANNTVVKIPPKRLIRCSNAEIEYVDDEGRKLTKVFDNATLLKNGMPTKYSFAEATNVNNGEITLIDNDDDGRVELVFVESYENALVSSVKNEIITFYDEMEIAGEKRLKIDTKDYNKKYELYDAEGKKATFDMIEKDSLLSVYVDEYKTRYRIYISNNVVNGIISSIYKDYLVIEGEDYYYSANSHIKAALGDSVEAYIDHKGEIGLVKKGVQGTEYGYIIGAKQDGFEPAMIQMVIASQVRFTADVDDFDADNVTSTPVLVCENEEIRVFEVKDRLNVNGARVELENIPNAVKDLGPVRVILGEDGKLKKIETMDLYGGDYSRKLYYNVYDKTFAGNADNEINAFRVNENTKMICIPEVVNSLDDYLVTGRIEKLDNRTGVLVQSYDFDEITKCVRLVVVTKGMDAEYITPATPTSSGMCMVVENIQTWNEEKDAFTNSLTLIEGGQLVTYETVGIREKNAAIAQLDEGDLITYYMNDNDLIENVLLIHSFGEVEGDMADVHPKYAYKEYLGAVTDISNLEIDKVQNKLSAAIYLNIYSSNERIYVPERNTPPIYLYEYNKSNPVSAASLADICPGTDKLYMVSISNTTPRACVILRGK